MIYNFDEKIDRKNTNCEKHDALKKVFGYEDLQGMWVADMDFKTPKFINEEIIKASQHSIYGYSFQSDALINSIINWQKNRHNFDIKKEELFLTNGVVPSYSACIEALCQDDDDEIIVQTPVYPPLLKFVELNNKKLVLNELINDNGYFKIDYEDLENKITNKTKALCLCSPHNPVGRVWSKDELKKLGDISLKHNIKIISDEIHSDITFKKFIPMATVSEDIADITITLNSAGKSFNIAGLNSSYVISKNRDLLNKFKKVAKKRQINSINYFGLVATKAAYEQGDSFIDQLNSYLKANIEFTKEYIQKNNSKIKFYMPDATYLLWLDFNETNLTHKQIRQKLLKDAKVGLNDGVSFSNTAKGFFRLNVALDRDSLKKGLEKICYAF
ncbi:MAG: MalY/PatB family protein [Campylobacterota bacterium]